jgi:tRNA pseudouridine55 synthase
MVSAVKVGGEALYRKAMRGEDIAREPREVSVGLLEMESFEPGVEAKATLRIRCSRGTYVRSLVADLGDAVGTGAHVGDLRRLAVGTFAIEAAIGLDAIAPAALRPMDDAVAGYPRRSVDDDGARALVHGKALEPAGIDGVYAVFGPDGLVAMAEDRGEEARSLCVLTQG